MDDRLTAQGRVNYLMRHWRSIIFWLVLSLSVVGNAAFIVAGMMLMPIDEARTVLVNEDLAGLVIEWRLPDGTMSHATPRLYDIALGAQPAKVKIDYDGFDEDLQRAETLAKSLGRFGSLEEITIECGSEGAIETFMGHIGPQPKLATFIALDVGFTDEASEWLVSFPALKQVAICSGLFTGEKLPRLPNVVDANFSTSSLTRSALFRVAENPRLEFLKVTEPESGAPEFLSDVRELRNAHPKLIVRGP